MPAFHGQAITAMHECSFPRKGYGRRLPVHFSQLLRCRICPPP